MPVRDVEELVHVDDPAWPEIWDLIDNAPTPARVLDAVPGAGRRVLHALQVTTHSYLGAIALHAGGIVADHGWFRLLGAGAPGLPDLATANRLGQPVDGLRPPPLMLVGLDAVGGRFAINGGALPSRLGEVCYFGPDTLSWDGLGVRYADFVRDLLSGDLATSFATLRWDSWPEEVERLPLDRGLALDPPPFTDTGADPGAAERRAVPLPELHAFYDEAARHLESL